ncbi:GNAT family N-acetyltransferase [Cardinium endosymbiont of Culicoides punctatus]|uniref:GNAT family N-acetyltransferase n=1 Tax=Cardinium endosymbiont of Culicoides punctatus TaxID=2304601 RepID=UPI001404767A|nr:GNAT family N-acetyltransferase [Cardinium endosymbiont of Culicoides punctatus]
MDKKESALESFEYHNSSNYLINSEQEFQTVIKLSALNISDYFEVCRHIDCESEDYLLLYPHERNSSREEQLRMIHDINLSFITGFIVYTDQDIPVGYILGMRKKLEKVKHVMNLVIAIRSKYFGKGYANLLLKSLENDARNQGVEIFRLSVLKNNIRAINFYKKHGFQIDGTLTHNVKIRNLLMSEWSMYKTLGNNDKF